MSKLTEAIARGYCTDENKVVDPQLVEAIAQEVEKLLESNGYHSEPNGHIYADFIGEFTEDEYELCLEYLSEVYRETGGLGLKVVHSELGDLASDPEPAKSENGIQAQVLLDQFMLESQAPSYQAQKQLNELRLDDLARSILWDE